jgi:phosphoribosylglycinamide formyltransferase-1
MAGTFVSETLTPLGQSFDPALMAQGEPGLPQRFRWRKREWHVAGIVERWKEHGDCAHGSGERYVRKHVYRVRTTDGWLLRLCFQRSFGRGRFRTGARWWVQRIEETGREAPGTAASRPTAGSSIREG